MNIIFLGPQGSGKGTQAQKLADTLNYTYIEAGKLLRQEAKLDPELSKIVNQQGKMAPNNITLGLIKRLIDEKSPQVRNLIFDGFPRSLEQLNDLQLFLDEKGAKIDKVILLSISEGETIKRLSARRTCDKCGKVYNLITNPPPEGGCPCGGNLIQREDDTPEAIRERLKIYWENTNPVVEEFKKQDILIELDGARPIETIFADILKEVN